MKGSALALAAALLWLALPADGMAGRDGRTIPYLPSTELGGAAAVAGALDHPDAGYCSAADWFAARTGGTLCVLSGVRTYQQTTETTCGPAAALIAYDYLGGDTGALDDVALSGMRGAADESAATSLTMMQRIFDSLGWEYLSTHTLRAAGGDVASARQLYRFIDAGFPVMVGWLEWSGHWTVLIGYDTLGTDSPDDDVLIMADPYDTFDHMQDGYGTVALAQFDCLWRLGEGDGAVDRPFIVAYPAERAGGLPAWE